jgi:hypothetical protein
MTITDLLQYKNKMFALSKSFGYGFSFPRGIEKTGNKVSPCVFSGDSGEKRGIEIPHRKDQRIVLKIKTNV